MWFAGIQGLLGEFCLRNIYDLFLLKPSRSIVLCPNRRAKLVLKSQYAKTTTSCILPAGDSTFDSHLDHGSCIVSLWCLGYYRWDPSKVRRARTRVSLCTWKTERKDRTKNKNSYQLSLKTRDSFVKQKDASSFHNREESPLQPPNRILLSVYQASERKAEQYLVLSRRKLL